MHIHVHDIEELQLYVANGVTGVRIMSGAKNTRALRAELSQQSISPEIVLASAIVDGTNPTWPGSIVVKKAEDARRAVDEIAASGADFVKVYNGIPRDAYFALADEARKRDLPFAGHVPDTVTAQEVSAAGQHSIEHLQGIALGCSSRQTALTEDLLRATFFHQRLVVFAEGFRSADVHKCQQLLEQWGRASSYPEGLVGAIQRCLAGARGPVLPSHSHGAIGIRKRDALHDFDDVHRNLFGHFMFFEGHAGRLIMIDV